MPVSGREGGTHKAKQNNSYQDPAAGGAVNAKWTTHVGADGPMVDPNNRFAARSEASARATIEGRRPAQCAFKEPRSASGAGASGNQRRTQLVRPQPVPQVRLRLALH
jgi:hypothetical protein